MIRQIKICDTTLKDGTEAPGCSMNLAEKIELARQLERLGVDVIEAGFPSSSPDEFEAVRAIAQTVKNCAVAGAARCVEKDIRRAYDAVKSAAVPRIHIFLPVGLAERKAHRLTEEQTIAQAAGSVSLARSLCSQVAFSAEDAADCDRTFLVRLFDTAVSAGAAEVNLADTQGYAVPGELYDLVAYVKNHLQDQNIVFSFHAHNDMGLGVANTLEAIRAGASQVRCTVGGIGTRAGNTPLEELVMALYARRAYYGCETKIDTRQIYRTCKLLSTITGFPIAPDKPVTGANALMHASGLPNTAGSEKAECFYEPVMPETIGIHRNRMALGSRTDKEAFAARLHELGYFMPEEETAQAFKRFQQLCQRKKEISDRDIEALCGDAVLTDVKEFYRLKHFVINCGTVISATAVVCLQKENGEEIEHVARGEGPIDAAFKAIDRIVKTENSLENWTMQAVTEGEDALGEAISKINCNGVSVTGRGLSTDILEASIKSYINAINKALSHGGKG